VTMFLNRDPPSGLEAEAVRILENVSRMEIRRGGSRDVLHNSGSCLGGILVMSFHLLSGEFNDHHDFENSNKVGGGLGTATLDVGRFITSSRGETICNSGEDGLVVWDSDSTGFSVAAISLVGKIVFWPEVRKIPPPTRLGLSLSLACFASLKLSGFEFGGLMAEIDDRGAVVVGLGRVVSEDDGPGAGVEAGLRDRVDTGSKVSSREVEFVGTLTS